MADAPHSTPPAGSPKSGGTPSGGLDWLPPGSGTTLPKMRSQSRRKPFVGKTGATLAVLAFLAVAGYQVRRLYFVDDTATADRIRMGTEFGVDIARRAILAHRAERGVWPASLKEVGMDGWNLTYVVAGDRFTVSGPDGADGTISRSGSVADLPPRQRPAGEERR